MSASLRAERLRCVPLLPAAVGMCLGILFDRHWGIHGWVYLVLYVLVLVAACRRAFRERLGIVLVLAASFCVGGMSYLARVRTVPLDSLEHVATESGRIARLRGTVITRPVVPDAPTHDFSRWTFSSPRTVFLVMTDSVEGANGYIPAQGRVRVTVSEGRVAVKENDRVELFGRLYSLRSPCNPGSYDWSHHYRNQGIVAQLRCEQRRAVRVLQDASALSWARFRGWLQATARGFLIDEITSDAPEESGLLEAMVLGQRSQLDRELNDAMIRSGCIHFLAPSGTNVAILIGFVWFMARLLRQSKWRCAVLMLTAAVLYAALTDARPSILRATVMVAAFCTSYLLARSTSHLNTLALAALVLLVFDPAMLFDIGLQLSFAAVLGVVYVSKALQQAAIHFRFGLEKVLLNYPFAEEDSRIIHAAAAQDRSSRAQCVRFFKGILRFLGGALAACLGAWAASFPIGAYYFQTVQPWGALGSAITYVLFALAMQLGFIKLLLSSLSPTLGLLVNIPLGWLDGALAWSVKKLASLPASSLSVPTVPIMLLGFFYVALCLFTLVFHSGQTRAQDDEDRIFVFESETKPIHRVMNWAFLLSLGGLVLALTSWLSPTPPSGRLVMTALAVGRGSAIVFELPDGRAILYDAGTSNAWDIGRSTVVPFLRHRKIRQIDRIYVSHPNLDHFSGLLSILDRIQTGPVVLNHLFDDKTAEDSPAGHLLDQLSKRGHRVECLDPAPAKWEIGGVGFELLWPPEGADESWTADNSSSVMRITLGGTSILLTGDIEESAQLKLIEQGNLDADVLVLPRHGSVTKTLGAFVKAVSPQAVLRSHQERMRETTDGLDDVIGTIPLYNTGDLGAVQVAADGDGIRVSHYIPTR